MPRSVVYKANSIVFFEGDRNENVYIVQSGKVLLQYTSIESGAQEQDIIKAGEFFGTQSALGHFPKEETATVLENSQLLVLTVPEFEAMGLKNSRVILKMLKVFSNKLRKVHKQVSDIMSSGKVSVDAEKGLYDIGEHYFTAKQYRKAAYIFNQFVNQYPNSPKASAAQQYKNESEACMQGKRPSTVSIPVEQPSRPAPTPVAQATSEPVSSDEPELRVSSLGDQDEEEITKEYYSAVSMFKQSHFDKALRIFKKIQSQNPEGEFAIKALFDIGKCYFMLDHIDECIKQLVQMIQSYSKHPQFNEALFFLGQCYQKKGINDKATGFYNKVLTLEDPESNIYRKTKKALAEVGGNA